MTTAIWRAAHLIAVLFLVSLGITALADLLPGSAALSVLGEHATPEQIAEFNAQYGLDDPLLVRYGRWISGVVTGDLGSSVRGSGEVFDLIAERLPVTLEIAVLAVLFTAVVAVPLALVSAERGGGILDRFLTTVSSALVSVPAFVVALLLVALIAVQFGAAPVAGWAPIGNGVVNNIRFALLPATTLALVEIPVLYRVLRADAASTLNQDFVLAARARGLSRGYVLFRHVLRPSSLSTVTMLGLTVGRLLGGTVIVEVIFALPGMGNLAVQSIYGNDIVVVQGVVMLVAVVYVATNALIDLSYRLLDPRVRTAR